MSNHSLEDLFSIELETHLKTLVDGFEALSGQGYQREIITKMLRAAHSLKGAARLVKKDKVEKLTHEIEDHLKETEYEKLIHETQLRKLSQIIVELGGKTQSCLSQKESHDGNTASLLHINAHHISELIHLASELSVLTKKIDALANKFESNDSSHNTLLSDTQRAASVSGHLQRLAYRLRLTPLHEVTRGLPLIAQNLSAQLHKEVMLRVFNGNTLIDRDLLKSVEPCLIQLLKNSIDHGFELPDQRVEQGKAPHGTITITAKQFGAIVEIEFKDNGAGIDPEIIREKVISKGLHDRATAQTLSKDELFEFLFLPDFSTRDSVSEISGRGIGLDIVKATLRELGGDVTLKSEIGAGTSFFLRIPSQVASFRALIFKSGVSHLGVPLSFVERIISFNEANIQEVCGKTILIHGEDEIPLIEGQRIFHSDLTQHDCSSIVILACVGKKLALKIDSIEGEQEVVVQPLDTRFQGIKKILGIAGGVGERVISILNPEQMLLEPFEHHSTVSYHHLSEVKDTTTKKILIVDDSLTVRELERRLLQQAGFDCEVAVDGVDGLEKIERENFSMIITDIDMPRMNGFELIERIKSHATLSQLPILIMSYKERQEDRIKGISLGADAFLSKGSFKDDSYLSTVTELLYRGQS